MSDDWKLQASYKHGDHDQHMLNVRGETALGLKAQLADLDAADVLSDVVATGLTLGALTNVVPLTQPAAPAAPAAPAPPPPAPPAADPWATATPAPPSFPPAPVAGATNSAAPLCVHGPRQYKTGTSAKGAWAAWMCSAQRNDPTKCEPQWIR